MIFAKQGTTEQAMNRNGGTRPSKFVLSFELGLTKGLTATQLSIDGYTTT
jgi:hypothetical protein